jgi:hypothetical protein
MCPSLRSRVPWYLRLNICTDFSLNPTQMTTTKSFRPISISSHTDPKLNMFYTINEIFRVHYKDNGKLIILIYNNLAERRVRADLIKQD